ncbi:MAG: biopolymer transporter ExbD [Oxalicibacterium faecigallinarum]|uniref:ExbD/TolR family protein n=1 Tax=Oxalicibacterium faecigallinarum TaxID=573741 RepID=UPI002806BF9C|nr:biopolymer transporter ExbD [Oxalicibacterium faecigallinarum]MDQ7968054.1 biopolymer transporter ExbD [Oxalicibacterium faecigallinarum]
MSFGGFDDHQKPSPMAEINVTPMVDVMLVLLVIFILAAPLFTHAIRLDLPSAASAPAPTDTSTVTLSIDASGNLFWNGEMVTREALEHHFAEAAQQQPQPQLQLRADKDTRYDLLAQLMSSAQGKGLTRLGIVTEQPTGNK